MKSQGTRTPLCYRKENEDVAYEFIVVASNYLKAAAARRPLVSDCIVSPAFGLGPGNKGAVESVVSNWNE